MKIEAFNTTKLFDKEETLFNILKAFKPNDYKNYLGAYINNNLVDLNKIIACDSKIDFLDLSNRDAMYIYQATLRYLFAYAINKLFPKGRVIFNYSISRSIFCQPVISKPLDIKTVSEIDNIMRDIISKDVPINKLTIPNEEAKKIYLSQGLVSKARLIDYREEETINIYELNGYYNYLYNYLAPTTGYVSNFRLNYYWPGVIMQYPRAELDGQIPDFVNEKVLGNYLKDSNKWGNITGASYVSDLNKLIETNKYKELINLCETRHNNMLAELGEQILKDIDNIKLIAVAGPSSSGKTTFTNRLRIELLSRGIKPLMISLDDYYQDDPKCPKNEDGTPDWEHIESLNVDLINEQILRLIEGEEVSLPIFDFKTRKTTFKEPIKLGKNQPILIEGIHALNPRLTESIPQSNKYNIYIAPHAQLHLDSQTPISMTEIRLLRRLVRDYRTRNSNPHQTISMWPSVRRGEFRWIYPFQENANYVFNSELNYELAVLKKPAMEILKEISVDSKEYPLANKLMNMLKYIHNIDEKWVPCNSILREFIGGSIFYDE
ncbi:MAG: nucleoside kinase [Anaeroplasmataceae bacterium]